MKTNKKGFTLIELLVVVLIIGILAAIAVPQYQKAVVKSQYTQAITLVNSIWQAQQAYYLANNSYTDDIDKLDITLPPYESKSGTHYISYSWGNCEIAGYYGTEVVCTLNSYPLRYLRPYKNNRRRCIADKNNAMAIKICENLSGGALPEDHDPFNYYLLP